MSTPAGKSSYALAAMVLLLGTGCGIPQLRQPGANPPIPTDFPGQERPEAQPEAQPEEQVAENSSRLGYEEFFHDPVLNQLIGSALANNLELRVLNEEIQITIAIDISQDRTGISSDVGDAKGIGGGSGEGRRADLSSVEEEEGAAV